MEDKRAKRPWVRWLMLAMALMELWLMRSDIQEYQQAAAAGIFTPESFAAWAAEERLQWLFYGSLALIFLFHFFTWKVPQNTRKMYLADGVLFGLMDAGWAISAFCLPFRLLSGWGKLLWCGMAAALLAGTGHGLWKYRKRKKVFEAG